ncbi:hypothetical protein TVAG_163430 [Trichomonas vaginalis G3]|uniref:Uncharacterized protein n=1 Tax=Trichomonas vaginalis (strain ATCC PRA-98 / G3) TaxID=412133 RepID=A2DG20_TRIV3|nr:hypothetical protein TVAGG3_0953370 [Trichomonas vaginalis G3]EAY20647.1 hypothetical protein TVAG_163430 [Trichomonas vaginalis G3]KAI5487368.1 hypothetical protein TVAGG3_0953370 [Trichomonas vaginalis G3]|eukprot:XP_001581633.1 hypothetical protein [Trichomonas vaginalis G3]
MSYDISNIKEMLDSNPPGSEEYTRLTNHIICNPLPLLEQLNNFGDYSNKNLAEFIITILFHIFINNTHTEIKYVEIFNQIVEKQQGTLSKTILAYIYIIVGDFSTIIQQKNFSQLNQILQILISNYNKYQGRIIDIINEFYEQLKNNLTKFEEEGTINDHLTLIYAQLINLHILPQLDDFVDNIATNFELLSASCSAIPIIKLLTSLIDYRNQSLLELIGQEKYLEKYLFLTGDEQLLLASARLMNSAYKVSLISENEYEIILNYLDCEFISVSQESLIYINHCINQATNPLSLEVFDHIFIRAVEYINTNEILYDTKEYRFYIQTLVNFYRKQIKFLGFDEEHFNFQLNSLECAKITVFYSMVAELIRYNDVPLILDYFNLYQFDGEINSFHYRYSYFKMINAALMHKQHFLTPEFLGDVFNILFKYYSVYDLEFIKQKLGNLIYSMALNYARSSITITLSTETYESILQKKPNSSDIVKALALLLFAFHDANDSQVEAHWKYIHNVKYVFDQIIPEMQPFFIMKLDPKLIQLTSQSTEPTDLDQELNQLTSQSTELINSINDKILTSLDNLNYIQCLPFLKNNLEIFKGLYNDRQLSDVLGPYVTALVSFVQLYKPFSQPWYEDFIIIYMTKRIPFMQNIKFTVKTNLEVRQILEVLHEIYQLISSLNISHFNIPRQNQIYNFLPVINEFLRVLLIKYNDCCEILELCIKIVTETDEVQMLPYTFSFLFAPDFDIFLPKYTKLINEVVIPCHSSLKEKDKDEDEGKDEDEDKDKVTFRGIWDSFLRSISCPLNVFSLNDLGSDFNAYVDFCRKLDGQRLRNPYSLIE